MSLMKQRNLERRLRCVDSRRTGRLAAGALFGPSCRLLDAAQELERATGRRSDVLGVSGAVAAVECMGPTLEAVATANLQLSLLASELVEKRSRDDMAGPGERTGDPDTERAMALLFGASQNMRIAAEAAKLAAVALRPDSGSPG
jgi:hypothetical protein